MSPLLALVSPTAALADSYRAFVTEFVACGEKLVPFVLAFPNDDIDAMIASLEACARGVGLPEGRVPHSTYWLVRSGVDVVGVSNLRHTLTPALRRDGGNIGYGVRPSARGRGYASEMLRLTLHRAAAAGLARVLLTCAKVNHASARVIVKNGGVLESEAYLEDRGEFVQRYWISVPSAVEASHIETRRA